MKTANTKCNEASMLNKILKYSDESPTFVGDFVECMRIFYAVNRTHNYYEVAKWVDGQSEFELEGFLNSIVQISAKLSGQIDDNNRESYSFYLKMLHKLSNHIELEIFREGKEAIILNRTEEAEKKLTVASNLVTELRETSDKQFNLTLVKLNEAEVLETESIQKLDKATKKLDSAEMGYISTLGIFAGIVMAFAGVFSFTSSAFEHVSSLNFWKLSFLILIAVFGLINLIYWLFYCVSLLLHKEDFKTCSFTGNTSCLDCKKECNGFEKTWHKNDKRYFVLNIILVLMIVAVGIAAYLA